MIERSTFPKPASQSNVAFFGSKKNENPITESMVSSSLTMGEILKTLALVSKPELPTAPSDFRPGQTIPSTPTTELLASLKPENQINVGHISSPVMDLASNKKSEQLSAFQINSEKSNDGKTGSLDVITDEDEMEEAPESGLGAERFLGNLGGFGIGSAPNSTTVKPNPFGFGVMNKTATPVSSPFTPPAPTGEHFRPASFSFQSQQSQPANAGAFSIGFSTGSTPQVPTASGFGQPPQFVGQKSLGSVLGTFGQSRQLGTSLSGSGIASPTGFASGSPGVSSSGFGGFAAGASSGGGFSSLSTSGAGGFAAAATGAGGFAAAATAGAGFTGAVSVGGGFAGAGFTGTGFGAFNNQQGGGGFSAFGIVLQVEGHLRSYLHR